MKLIRSTPGSEIPAHGGEAAAPRHFWKVLVVDDEADIRTLTRLNLKGFTFDGRELEFVEAASAYEARQKLSQHDDFALALIDVVMETDDAGLRLVEYIRKDLGNAMIRLVVRTGQPGACLGRRRGAGDHPGLPCDTCHCGQAGSGRQADQAFFSGACQGGGLPLKLTI